MLYVRAARMQKAWLLIIHLAIAATMAITLFYTLRSLARRARRRHHCCAIPGFSQRWPLAIAAASMVMSSSLRRGAARLDEVRHAAEGVAGRTSSTKKPRRRLAMTRSVVLGSRRRWPL